MLRWRVIILDVYTIKEQNYQTTYTFPDVRNTVKRLESSIEMKTIYGAENSYTKLY